MLKRPLCKLNSVVLRECRFRQIRVKLVEELRFSRTIANLIKLSRDKSTRCVNLVPRASLDCGCKDDLLEQFSVECRK